MEEIRQIHQSRSMHPNWWEFLPSTKKCSEIKRPYKVRPVKQVVLNGVTVFLPYKWQNINGEKLGSKKPNSGGYSYNL